MTSAPSPLRLWLAALAGLIYLLLGIGLSRFGYSPLVPALIQSGWFTPGQAAYLGAANLAGYLLGAGGAGWIATQRSRTVSIRAALVVCTAAFAACAFPLGFGWYFLWRFASGAAGGVLMVLGVPAILALAPLGQRGRVGGLVFTGVGLGVTLSGTLVPWLLGFGLPEVWAAFAGLSAALTLVAWRGLPEAPAPWAGRGVAVAAELGRAEVRSAASRARLSPPLVLSVLAYACFGAGFVPHTVFWVDYIARGLGLGIGAGGSYWVLFGLGALCGPLVLGSVADRIGFTAALQWTLLADAVFIALPLLSSASWSLTLSSAGVGSLASGITSMASGRVTELAQPRHQPQVWGWMTLAFSIAYAGAAYLLSYLFARTGSYSLLFTFGAASFLGGGILEWAGSRFPGGSLRGAHP
jgi:predicted MFS family arabinose efflux permease